MAADSSSKDSFAVPVEILAGRLLSSGWQKERCEQRRPTEILASQRIGLNRLSQRAGEVDAQPAVDGEETSVEGDVVGGASGQAVARIKTLGRGAVFPGFDMARQQHPLGAERR